MEQRLKEIIALKKEELKFTDESFVDYPVLEEEINDAEFALANIGNDTALLSVLKTTTSNSLYDLLCGHLKD